MSDLPLPEGCAVAVVPEARVGAMSQVWKFPVGVPTQTGRAWIDLPDGAELLSVGIQDGEMVVWALIQDFEAEVGTHRLIVVNTGMEVPNFPEGARFLGTVTTSNGIVWHVWDGDAETTA